MSLTGPFFQHLRPCSEQTPLLLTALHAEGGSKGKGGEGFAGEKNMQGTGYDPFTQQVCVL